LKISLFFINNIVRRNDNNIFINADHKLVFDDIMINKNERQDNKNSTTTNKTVHFLKLIIPYQVIIANSEKTNVMIVYKKNSIQKLNLNKIPKALNHEKIPTNHPMIEIRHIIRKIFFKYGCTYVFISLIIFDHRISFAILWFIIFSRNHFFISSSIFLSNF